MIAAAGTAYEIGHEALAEALAGRIDIDLGTVKAAIRKRPENRIEILIAAATEALQRRPNADGIALALQMLEAVAKTLDTTEIEEIDHAY